MSDMLSQSRISIEMIVHFRSFLSLIFAARSMHKRGLCRHAVSVCLSVCLSVTFMSSVKTNKGIFRFFTPSGSQAILVFPCQTGWRYSDGNGGAECKGVWKNHDLWPISGYISELVQNRAIVTWKANRNRTQAFKWYHFEWPWVTSNPDFKVMISFNVK